jgi:hypothetical protein
VATVRGAGSVAVLRGQLPIRPLVDPRQVINININIAYAPDLEDWLAGPSPFANCKESDEEAATVR